MLNEGIDLLCQNDPVINGIIAPRYDEIILFLSRYISLIEYFNPALSLLGTNDHNEIIVRHILDSLSPLGIIQRKIQGREIFAVDVGSGAGLPGIPLAITLPEVNLTLIERKGRRAGFLRNVIADLKLDNIFIEEEEMEKVKPARFSLVVFRAFKPLEPKILKKLFRLCREDGILAAYKGRREKIETEIASLMDTLEKIQCDIIPCPVPFLEEERHLILIGKS